MIMLIDTSTKNMESEKMGKIREGVTIKVQPETRERLNDLKRGRDTYDDVINRLIDKQGCE